MVREQDGTGVVALQIVVDLGLAGSGGEYVASVATWIAETAVGRGWRVQLVTSDVEQLAPSHDALGSPFGPPPRALPSPPTPVQVRSAHITTSQEARRQLATAATGSPPIAPPWRGLTCTVSPGGIGWT